MFNRVRNHKQTDSSEEFDRLVPEFDADLLPTELRELYDSWAQSGQAAALHAGSVAESDWPVAIYVPERYEERYAYPLIIWFHSDDTDEDQLEDVMTAVSSQNYCGLALRGNHFEYQTGGYRWNTSDTRFSSVPLQDLLYVTTCRLRQAFHIHSERIFLAGSGSGADAALHAMIQRPDWFAGAILLDPTGDRDMLRTERLEGLRGKPILQTVSRETTGENLAQNVECVRVLRSAGAEIEVRLNDRSIDPISLEARFIDHWIMGKLNRAALV